MMKFLNKKALITGSSKGIGKAIVLQLAKEGAEVVIHYNKNQHEAQKIAETIESAGGKSHLLHADLFDPAQAIRLGEEAWDILQRIDYLINNAGVSYKKDFLETTIEDVDYFTNINFKSTLLLTKVIANKMIHSNTSGSIYTITSVNAIQPAYGFSVYGATKGALETLMKGVALELASFNIKVNTFVLGAIETDINATVWQDAEKLKTATDRIPMHRFGTTEEVARVICNLLSCDSYMTGSTVKIDGGWLLRTGN
jgi:NAD(P)-dependent dehydrogenase (short-subunit alcohol dehydrogenase family)